MKSIESIMQSIKPKRKDLVFLANFKECEWLRLRKKEVEDVPPDTKKLIIAKFRKEN